jgi:hypothetical protein
VYQGFGSPERFALVALKALKLQKGTTFSELAKMPGFSLTDSSIRPRSLAFPELEFGTHRTATDLV